MAAFPSVFASVLTALAATVAPFALAWAGLGLWLGARQKTLAGDAAPRTPSPTSR